MALTQTKTLAACPLCGGAEFDSKFICKDYTVSKENFQIVACRVCQFHFTNPRPADEDLGKYYESEDYVSHSNTSKGLVNWLYQRVRAFTLRKKLALVNRLSGKGILVDLGCGTGYFLNTCKQDGWNAIGIEPSPQARKVASEQFGLEVLDEPGLQQMKPGSIDAITMWHVLEHVPDLHKRTEELKRILKPGGVLIIAVPNRSSYDAQHYGEHWAAWDVPRHLWHFAPADIARLFEAHGMEVKETLPMRFDSYYVSMLSEKYKSGSTSLISAFLTGARSNRKAGSSPRFSSQIYVIRNK